MFKSRAVSAEVAWINDQTHLELEHKCLDALVAAMNVSALASYVSFY